MWSLRNPSALAIAGAVAPWTWFIARDVHPWLDAVALGWPVIGFGTAALLALSSVMLRRQLPGVVAASWLAATMAVVVLPWTPSDAGRADPGVRVVAANTFGTRTSPPSIEDDIADERPDVVVVSEVSDELDATLRRRFRHAARNGDVAVYSSMPIGQIGRAPARQRGMRVVIGGRFVLYALHLQKPGVTPSSVEVGFRTHRRIVDAVIDAVRREQQPVVLAGDLNLVDRSSGYRRLTRALDDAMRSSWSGPTSLRRRTQPLLARIDHILIDEAWCADDARLFELRASNHRGVAATVGPCA